MDLNWIFQTVMTLGIGAIAYFMKRLMDESKSTDEAIVKQLKETQEKIESERKESQQRDNELAKQINDLKAEMPMIYVLREDWIRVSNATDEKISKMDSKVDKILSILGTGKEKGGE
ncbi:MAG: hypothetical protein ACI4LO_02020 [Anaerovoracaceae bacterium]